MHRTHRNEHSDAHVPREKTAERPTPMTRSDEPTIDEIERAAEDIAYETDLGDREAMVLAGMQLGATEDTIATAIARSVATVRKTKRHLRQRRREIGDRATSVVSEKELLDDVLGE